MAPRRRVQLALVMTLMLVGAAAEIFTLGAVVPFLGLLINPTLLDQPSGWGGALAWLATHLGTTKLIAASTVFVFFAAIAAGLRLLLSWASLTFVFSVGADFSRDVYRNTLLQPYSYHIEHNSSQTLASIEKVSSLVMGIMTPAMQIVIATIMVVGLLSAMLWVDYITSIAAAILFGSMYAALSAGAKNKLRKNSEIISRTGDIRFKAIQEGLGGIRDIILDGSHDVYTKVFSEADREQKKALANNGVLAASPKYLVESAGMIMIVALAFFLTEAHGAERAIPVLGALAIGAQRLLPYMQSIYNALTSMRGSYVSAQDALRLLNLNHPLLKSDSTSLIGADEKAPILELSNISFRYIGSKRDVLRNAHLRVLKGERIGIVGQTGSGKSTLIDIVMGLLYPDSGQVSSCGVTLNPANIKAWQRQVSHVPQSIFLIDASIAENIALGTPPAAIDKSRLNEALRLAQLTEVIDALPEREATRVGERGVQLSGGQRQRIGIARALYKHANLLILDEATSALDSETETRVMNAIYSLRPDLTVILIAHRVSTLERCNRIVSVRDGMVWEN